MVCGERGTRFTRLTLLSNTGAVNRVNGVNRVQETAVWRDIAEDLPYSSGGTQVNCGAAKAIFPAKGEYGRYVLGRYAPGDRPPAKYFHPQSRVGGVMPVLSCNGSVG